MVATRIRASANHPQTLLNQGGEMQYHYLRVIAGPGGYP